MATAAALGFTSILAPIFGDILKSVISPNRSTPKQRTRFKKFVSSRAPRKTYTRRNRSTNRSIPVKSTGRKYKGGSVYRLL